MGVEGYVVRTLSPGGYFSGTIVLLQQSEKKLLTSIELKVFNNDYHLRTSNIHSDGRSGHPAGLVSIKHDDSS